MRWLSAAGERLHGLLFGARADRETTEEMRFHLEMEAERLMRASGLDAAEARRQAAISFGGVDKHSAAVRDARGFGWLSGIPLDVKLGMRMLVRYPGLTITGVLSLAIAVALAAAWFEFLNDMASPKLPMADFDRVVVVQSWDRSAAQQERRVLHDFEVWRGEVRSITQLSAYSTGEFNVTTDDGHFAPLRGVRLTASALGIVGVEPRIGRRFAAADDAAGAPLVVLIGHDVWQDLYGGDRSILGRTLLVADEPATIVGVMPAGFGFPTSQQIWLPLRERATALDPRSGPNITVFGRLAAGATLDEARAELAAIGERMAAAHPATHEQLRPRVRRLADVMGMGAMVRVINVPFLLFLLVVCANVAILVFARTATRSGEIAVRSALGASRRRLVLQLMAEALVLTALAAALGLAIAQWGLRQGMALFWEVQQMAPPYFFDDTLAPVTILYALVLSVVAAAVIGGIPALKATKRELRPQLLQSGATGGGVRFGAVSTGVIVVQVALCVAFIPVAIQQSRALLPERGPAASFPADEYLAARIVADVATLRGGTPVGEDAGGEHAGNVFAAVKQRLGGQPGVSAAAYASRMPGFNHPVERMQLEADSLTTLMVRAVAVDPDFFGIVGARVVAGRGFDAGEFESAAQPVIVDAGWAHSAYGGASPLGQRVSFSGDAGPWHEIVGVVEGMPRAIGPGTSVAIYRPLRPADHPSLQLYLRTNVPPATLVPDVHAVISAVDPTLTMHELKPLDEIWRPVLKADLLFAAGLNAVGVIILLFALIGIYSLVSFTVAQRAREIAIRVALGADPRRIIVALFSRAVAQIGFGVLAGAVLVSLAIARTPAVIGLVAAVAVLVMLVGLAACVPPALRALRIQPAAALKAE